MAGGGCEGSVRIRQFLCVICKVLIRFWPSKKYFHTGLCVRRILPDAWFMCKFNYFVSRDGVVDRVTDQVSDCITEEMLLDFRQRTRDFFLFVSSRQVLGIHSTPLQQVLGTLFPKARWPVVGSWPSDLSRVEVKNEWSSTWASTYAFLAKT
jgi:hypothetical protein